MRTPLLTLLVIATLALTGCVTADAPVEKPADSSNAPAIAPAFEKLERESDVSLGVYAIDTATGATVEYNADDRFAFASTYKALAAAAVLDKVGIAGLDKRVTFTTDDLVTYSPVTKHRVAEGMTLREIAVAAITLSDNTAGNLLLGELGGPAAFDAQLELLGDDVPESVRLETELNEAAPGDTRDTSSARALATSLKEFAFGDVLDEAERSLFAEWLQATETGETLIRAELPPDWKYGDKSGAAGYGTRNDIGIIWPTDGGPIVVAVLSTRGVEGGEYDDAVVASAARTAVDALRG